MSAAVLAKSGYRKLLGAIQDGIVLEARLYVNDPALGPDMTAAQFVEPIYVGYQAVTLTPWTPPAIRLGRAFTVADPPYWIYTDGTPPDPIRGYYVVDSGDGEIVWAWRKPGAAFGLGPSAPVLTAILTMYMPAA